MRFPLSCRATKQSSCFPSVVGPPTYRHDGRYCRNNVYLCFLLNIYRKNPVDHMVLDGCGKDFAYTVTLRFSFEAKTWRCGDGRHLFWMQQMRQTCNPLASQLWLWVSRSRPCRYAHNGAKAWQQICAKITDPVCMQYASVCGILKNINLLILSNAWVLFQWSSSTVLANVWQSQAHSTLLRW